jgi:hypothetical protein
MNLDSSDFSYCSVYSDYMRLIVEHRTPYVREAAANSLATALPSKPDLFDVYLDKFVNLYHDKVHPHI